MFPMSTGEAARFLSATEPQLNDLVRRGLIKPPPQVSAGRRVWHLIHVYRAADLLGRLTPELFRQMTEAPRREQDQPDRTLGGEAGS